MPELMKNKYYNYASLHQLAFCIKGVYPSFQVDDFVGDIMDKTWDVLELKDRMRKITVNLLKHLPTDYEQALGIIDQVIAGFPVGLNDNALIYFPDFVEIYGQDEYNWDLSIVAIERYTITHHAAKLLLVWHKLHPDFGFKFALQIWCNVIPYPQLPSLP